MSDFKDPLHGVVTKDPSESDHPAVLLKWIAENVPHDPECEAHNHPGVKGVVQGPAEGCTCWVNHAHQVAIDNNAVILQLHDYRHDGEPEDTDAANFRIRAGENKGKGFIRITLPSPDIVMRLADAERIADQLAQGIREVKRRLRRIH